MKCAEKFIIRVGEGVSDCVAAHAVELVIAGGKVSVDCGIRTYCLHTCWRSGLSVSVRPNSEHSHTFWVYVDQV